MIYYLPFWFQGVNDIFAIGSGIRNIPMILSLVIFSLISGGLVSTFGYYAPFILASTILMAIGYQILFSIGAGIGMQQTMVAVQASLKHDGIAIGTAIIIFTQTLGGALFIYVAQNIFQNKLVSNVATANIDGLDPYKEFLPVIPHAYNAAINTFYVSTAMAAISVFCSVLFLWNSVKGKTIELTAT
ncbi:hypothetical protein CI102_11143 [Trichoderma harzianum]|nr:hypothetical protein CI102_11143 [Trichoderma harzianum]